MVMRNSWMLPAAILIVVGILAVILVGGVATALGGASPRPQATSNILTVPGNYSTIQAAVNAAKAGDIIQVNAGTYNGSIMLDKAVSLTAATFNQPDQRHRGHNRPGRRKRAGNDPDPCRTCANALDPGLRHSQQQGWY